MKLTRRIIAGVGVVAIVIGSAGPVAAGWEEGVAAFKNKEFSKAVEEFQGVTKTNPDYPGGYYMLGLAQSQMGRLSQALASLRKASELDKGNAQYQVALGQVLVQAKQFRDGYTVLKAVDRGKLAASQRGLHALLFARAATKTNHPGEAVQVLNRQVRAQSKDSRLYQALGVAYNDLGDDVKAYEAFARAYRLNSRDLGSGRSAVYAAITAARRSRSVQGKSRYYAEAATISAKLAAARPTFEHQLLAGETLLGGKEYKRALSWFEKARSKQPKNSLVHFYIGQCHSSTGAFDSALPALQQALKLGPTSKLRRQIYNQMGYVYAKQKRYDKAIVAYQNAGNGAKVREMESSLDKQKQNLAARKEREEFQRKIRALLAQADELEKLGQMDEAQAIRDQVRELQSSLKK